MTPARFTTHHFAEHAAQRAGCGWRFAPIPGDCRPFVLVREPPAFRPRWLKPASPMPESDDAA